MNRQYVNYSCLEFFFVHSSCWMLSLGTEKLKISYCMIKILILGWRNYCIWKLYRIRCFLLRFSGMSTSERKMFSNKIQASPTYSILTRKRKDFTDCWNSVSIKQVRLTQFWRILGDDTMKSWATFQSSKSNLLNSDMLTVLKPVLPE